MRTRFRILLEKFKNADLSPSEKKEMTRMLQSHKYEKELEQAIELDWNAELKNLSDPESLELIYQQILIAKEQKNKKVIHLHLKWWAVAATILLTVGTGYYFLSGKKEAVNLASVPAQKTNDIAPPNSVNAMITLGNGEQIILDSAGNGTVATQGMVKIKKLADGQIAYSGTSTKVMYNTLSNPRGSKVISLTLDDGSKVWLNAESSLKFPTAFLGSERKVEITGEAYFEVAHHANMPFTVSKGTASVKVLGTHFNVNAYEDESSINVTLLEGMVEVHSANNNSIIKPGQQARINGNGKIQMAKTVDVDEVMAWKNGLFSYKGNDMRTIMREVSRWYNVEVVFKAAVHEKFYAEVSRDIGVSSLLKMLEATKAVHFKIEGKKIIVMP